jgi:hypothetical protein
MNSRALMLLLLFFFMLTNGFCYAKSEFAKIKAEKKHKYQSINYQENFIKTEFDLEIEKTINFVLGRNYRRANVFDFFPLEIKDKVSEESKIALLEYYNYARKELEYISKSKFPKVLQQDLNLDGIIDYAILVYDIKKEEILLAILDSGKTHYLQSFSQTFLELMNAGKYPTTIVSKNLGLQEIYSPAIKLVSFEQNANQVLYFNKKNLEWQNLEVEI